VAEEIMMTDYEMDDFTESVTAALYLLKRRGRLVTNKDMYNSKYEAVRAKIVEACPELIELSFGCKISWKREKDLLSKTFVFLDMTHDGILIVCLKNGVIGRRAIPLDECEILGHPIRLSHVLRAMNPNYLVDSHGLFWKFTVGGNPSYQVEYCKVTWELEKDNLSLQSPEVWDFLFKILCE